MINLREAYLERVSIDWRDPYSDWKWFWLVGFDGEWVKLKGADSPDGSVQHDGDTFWVHRSEIMEIRCEDQPA